jgi:hypothetical protein
MGRSSWSLEEARGHGRTSAKKSRELQLECSMKCQQRSEKGGGKVTRFLSKGSHNHLYSQINTICVQPGFFWTSETNTQGYTMKAVLELARAMPGGRVG